MKPAQQQTRKSGPVAVLAITAIALCLGLAWMVLRGGSPQPQQHAPRQAASAAAVTRQVAEAAPEHNVTRHPGALPAQQLKLGDSYVYQIDSTRIVSTSASKDVKITPVKGG